MDGWTKLGAMETRYTLATWYTAILGTFSEGWRDFELGAGAELVALEFEVKTATSEAEFASSA